MEEAVEKVQSPRHHCVEHSRNFPNFRYNDRPRTTYSQSKSPLSNKNYHQRNVDYLKELSKKNHKKHLDFQKTKEKEEETRKRLADLVLSKQSKQELPSLQKDSEKSRTSDFKSRYFSLIQNLQESNRARKQQEMLQQQKQQLKQKKLKEELGLEKVTSKLSNPTVCSLLNKKKVTESELAQLKGDKYTEALPVFPKNQGSTEDPKKVSPKKETETCIVKKAREYLDKLSQKKEEELKKEKEALEKETRKRAALRQLVLARNKTIEKPKPPPMEEKVIPKKPPRKLDEEAINRLSQAPRRHSGPIMTDFLSFRKKHKLDESTKIFILSTYHETIRESLLARSNLYLGRLV